ncbi:hypothetical protein F0562_019505 [Nyssa sinensis]|uniref:Uncharacterized protein n=1 Tax=Nyssa sinensis TaxID=561372 RepID=A0A5J5BU35_9ASTE|nr:hypothetical protein F0562_019505 [Nyssa sinensis]
MILIERVPQPLVAPRFPTGVVICEPKSNSSTLPSDSASLFVRRSSRGSVVATGTSSSSFKELHSVLSNQRTVVAMAKLFQTLIDTVKLAEIESPSLEHQVSYNFSRAMVGMFDWISHSEGHACAVNNLQEDLTRAQQEIDSLCGQIVSLDDAHEFTNDDLLKATNMRKIRHGATRVEMHGRLAVGFLCIWVIPWLLSSLPEGCLFLEAKLESEKYSQ